MYCKGLGLRNVSFSLLFVLILLLLLFNGSCCKKEAVPDKEKASGKDALVLVLSAEPKTLDPAYITGIIEIRVAAALFEGLTVYHEKTLEPEPGIAREWTVSPDKTVYTFTIREAYWSNGDRITPEDFVYSWQRILMPDTAAEYAYMLFPIKNAERFHKGECIFSEVGIRTDGDDLVVELESPTPYFLDLTSFVTYYPVHRITIMKYGDQWTRPRNIVCSGPFLLKKHLMHDRLVMKKNPAYHAAESVKLDTLVMRIIPDDIIAFNEYDAGKADIITTVPISIFRNLQKQARKDLYVNPMLGVYFIRFNVTVPPFNNPLVRKAIAWSIDREFITSTITGTGERPADSFVPPGTACRSAFSAKEVFNPDTARELLKQAGFEKGKGFPKIEYLYNTSEDHKRVAHAVSDMLKKHLSIIVTPLNMEWKVYLKKTTELDYSLARSGWIGDYNDPLTFLNLFTTGNGNNRTGWSSPEYDRLIKEASRIQDQARRAELFYKAEEILAEEMPVIPLYFYVSRIMYRKENVGGVYPNVRNWIRPGALYMK